MTKSKKLSSDCFSNQKFVLNLFGLLYNENVLFKVYAINLLILLTIYLFSVIPEIVTLFYSDLKKFVYSLIFEVGLLSCLLSMFVIFWNRFKLEQLIEKLQLLDELSDFKHTEGETVFLKHYKDIVRKQSSLGLAWITFAQITCILVSVMLSLNEEKWILPYGSGSTIINNDNLQFIVQIITYAIFSTVAYVLLIIYINVLTLICGHCELLQKYISLLFTEYQGEIYKELDVKLIEKKIPDWESFKVQLQHIVPYHVGIIDTANQIETIFSIINFIIFGGVSICSCLLVYHTQLNIQVLEIVKDVVQLIAGYFVLIFISIYGENLATESVKIASTCYELDFVGSDLRIQKSLVIIMAVSQRPITPTIGKMKVLGLRTMLSIFQTIYSYYTILRNLMNE